MAPVQRTLLIVGAALVIIALAWPLISKLPFGKLPGDLVIKRGDFTFFLPLTTMTLVSIVLTAIFRLFGK